MLRRAAVFATILALGSGSPLRASGTEEPGTGQPGAEAGAANPGITFTDDVIIHNTSPQLSFLVTDSSDVLQQAWRFRTSSHAFEFRDETAGTSPVAIVAPAAVNGWVMTGGGSNGNVGTGTLAPLAAFHVMRRDGSAQLRVEEASATVQSRNLVRLVNSGASTFRFDNRATDQAWGFGGLGSGNFFIGSTPGQLFALTLTPGGDLTVAGGVTQGSDRDSKAAVEAADPAVVLAGVARLPLSTWSYKTAPGERHLGPMAQDFAALFGLGADDTHIALGDVAGVSLAAIQALEADNRRLEQQIADLATRVGRECR